MNKPHRLFLVLILALAGCLPGAPDRPDATVDARDIDAAPDAPDGDAAPLDASLAE